ncbi:laccase, multicopper oxidase, benzenediol:oxygen oxidorectuctase [Teratosphaeriaceae sp. CCFEE 6253]|nr:laccase, multicopper oxidase, benzenediol:oxygen oxidorectuctase [Teratosphaeriaceae sp. CCFEE 6253]
MQGRIRSIIRCDGAPGSGPTTIGIVQSTACHEEQATPWIANAMPQDQFANAVKTIELDFNVSTVNGPLVQWVINGSDHLRRLE